MEYGRAIRIARAARGLSQKELAQEAGLDQSYISLIEKGARTPRESALDALASTLAIPSDLLKLLAADKDDLVGLTPSRARAAGMDLLRVFVEIREDSSSKRRSFYVPFFETTDDAERFIAACEAKAPPDLAAKVIMHQAQRLVSISDDLPQIRPHQEALRLLFLLMCAENISKLQHDFTGEGQSRAHVRRFFTEFLCQADRHSISNGFTDSNHRPLSPLGFDRAIELLYDLRCDVVHEGNYSDFAFHDGTTPMVNTNPNVIAEIRLADVRNIVVRGCIAAARTRL